MRSHAQNVADRIDCLVHCLHGGQSEGIRGRVLTHLLPHGLTVGDRAADHKVGKRQVHLVNRVLVIVALLLDVSALIDLIHHVPERAGEASGRQLRHVGNAEAHKRRQ
eukprot:EC799450.1.p2 GENE.EC799450.1~~EC799450.1.p2  ORF type:complete len:108 (-),score=24.61 EC799450.1:327-650(-)